MTETWLPFCVRRPGPAGKHGYARQAARSLAEIEGEVKHSMEGALAAALAELDRPERQASWTFSLPFNGPPLQHYPLEAITWHAGSFEANRRFVGLEHEGRAGQPLSAEQIRWTAEITRALRRLCPAVGARPPLRRVNLWEHREMVRFGAAATACPSGRIPWDELIALLKEEPVTRDEIEALLLERDRATVRLAYSLRDGEKIQAAEALDPAQWLVDRRGDMPYIRRLDDSAVAAHPGPARPVPLDVIKYLKPPSPEVA